MMVLKFFKPDVKISWDEWDELTGFEKEKGTWASAVLLWFKNNGFDVRHITLFDYEDFIENGGDYLIRLTGKKVGQWQIEHSNIPLEQKRAKTLLRAGVIENRQPTQKDIIHYLENGYLVRVLVNMATLNDKTGYIGHAIVVSGYDDEGFIIQDPGLPPIENRKVCFADFEAAWADPNEQSKELDAIKLL